LLLLSDSGLLDVSGNGFDQQCSKRVHFDLGGDGHAEPIAGLTGTDDAWLCLDRSGNGTIDSGKNSLELHCQPRNVS
jgi:hypothetical protein